jgi:hypothetical protein
MIDQARIAGWKVTREIDDGMEFVTFDGGNWRNHYMIGAETGEGRGRTFAVRITLGSGGNSAVAIKDIERDIAYAYADTTAT